MFRLFNWIYNRKKNKIKDVPAPVVDEKRVLGTSTGAQDDEDLLLVMPDWGDSEFVDMCTEYQSEVFSNFKNKQVKIIGSGKIKGGFSEFSQAVKNGQKHKRCITFVGHGSLDGVYYRGSGPKGESVSIPKLVSELSGGEHKTDFFLFGCQIGVGLVSKSSSPEKIKRKEERESALKEAMSNDCTVVAAAGNKERYTFFTRLLLTQAFSQEDKNYSAFEKALIQVANFATTIKIARKDEKGEFHVLKSNFEMPKNGQKMNLDYVKFQAVKRMNGILEFAKKSGASMQELAKMQVLKNNLEDQFVKDESKAREYFFTLLLQKYANQKLDHIDYLFDNLSMLDGERKVYHVDAVVKFADLHVKNDKAVLKIKEFLGESVSQLSKSAQEIIKQAQERDFQSKQLISDYVEILKKQQVKHIFFDEKLFDNAKFPNDQNFIKDFLQELRSSGIKFKILLPENSPPQRTRKARHIIGKENFDQDVAIYKAGQKDEVVQQNRSPDEKSYLHFDSAIKEVLKNETPFNQDFCQSLVLSHQIGQFKLDCKKYVGVERIVVDLSDCDTRFFYNNLVSSVKDNSIEFVVLVEKDKLNGYEEIMKKSEFYSQIKIVSKDNLEALKEGAKATDFYSPDPNLIKKLEETAQGSFSLHSFQRRFDHDAVKDFSKKAKNQEMEEHFDVPDPFMRVTTRRKVQQLQSQERQTTV